MLCVSSSADKTIRPHQRSHGDFHACALAAATWSALASPHPIRGLPKGTPSRRTSSSGRSGHRPPRASAGDLGTARYGEPIDRFADLMHQHLREGEPALRQYYDRCIVSRVEVGDDEIRVIGATKAVDHAVGRVGSRPHFPVPSIVGTSLDQPRDSGIPASSEDLTT